MNIFITIGILLALLGLPAHAANCDISQHLDDVKILKSIEREFNLPTNTLVALACSESNMGRNTGVRGNIFQFNRKAKLAAGCRTWKSGMRAEGVCVAKLVTRYAGLAEVDLTHNAVKGLHIFGPGGYKDIHRVLTGSSSYFRLKTTVPHLCNNLPTTEKRKHCRYSKKSGYIVKTSPLEVARAWTSFHNSIYRSINGMLN